MEHPGRDGHVLKSKHPESVVPSPDHLERYEQPLELVALDITNDTVLTLSSGGAGPGGIDSLTLQNWLLRFRKESNQLREVIASITRWLANDSPPLAAYRVLISN